tara:strand:- start:965 stop:1720 length:756 start_codon:yes stop_codon:yes gene_type:complete
MRLIARLDIKNQNLIKTINLEGLRVLGNPNKFAKKYYLDGADELIFMDLVASLYNRNNLHEIIKMISNFIFIPVTVGGGVRSINDALNLFNSGADKIAINTGAIKSPELLNDLIKRFGSQAIVLSIEAKKRDNDFWEVYTESGRQETGVNVLDWVRKCDKIGVGEFLLTSIDNEGTGKGFDIDLANQVTKATNIPIILSGGFGKVKDIIDASKVCDPDAVAFADALHYDKISIKKIREECLKANLEVRNLN